MNTVQDWRVMIVELIFHDMKRQLYAIMHIGIATEEFRANTLNDIKNEARNKKAKLTKVWKTERSFQTNQQPICQFQN